LYLNIINYLAHAYGTVSYTVQVQHLTCTTLCVVG